MGTEKGAKMCQKWLFENDPQSFGMLKSLGFWPFSTNLSAISPIVGHFASVPYVPSPPVWSQYLVLIRIRVTEMLEPASSNNPL